MIAAGPRSAQNWLALDANAGHIERRRVGRTESSLIRLVVRHSKKSERPDRSEVYEKFESIR